MSETPLLYFAYGALAYEQIFGALIGRRPHGFPTRLRGFQLCLQRLRHQPQHLASALRARWGFNFSYYALVTREHEKESNRCVTGMTWEISKEEREIIGAWKLERLRWFDLVPVEIEYFDGRSAVGETHLLPRYAERDKPAVRSAGSAILALENMEQCLAVARQIHAEQLRLKAA